MLRGLYAVRTAKRRVSRSGKAEKSCTISPSSEARIGAGVRGKLVHRGEVRAKQGLVHRAISEPSSTRDRGAPPFTSDGRSAPRTGPGPVRPPSRAPFQAARRALRPHAVPDDRSLPPLQVVRPRDGGLRRLLPRRARRGGRLPRPQRRGQEHHAAHAGRASSGPTAGKVRIAGHDLGTDPIAARASRRLHARDLAALPRDARRRVPRLPRRAQARPAPRPARGRRAAPSHETSIADVEDVVIGHLSKGYRQRVGLADALVASPPILILDEPTAGLDPNQIRDVRALIRGARQGPHGPRLDAHPLRGRGHLLAGAGHRPRPAGRRGVDRGHPRPAPRRRGAASPSGATPPSPRRPPRRSRGWRGSRGRRTLHGAHGHAGGRARPRAPTPGRVAEAVVAALVGAGAGVREVVPRAASLEQVFAELTAASIRRRATREGLLAHLQAGAALALRHAARVGGHHHVPDGAGHPRLHPGQPVRDRPGRRRGGPGRGVLRQDHPALPAAALHLPAAHHAPLRRGAPERHHRGAAHRAGRRASP